MCQSLPHRLSAPNSSFLPSLERGIWAFHIISFASWLVKLHQHRVWGRHGRRTDFCLPVALLLLAASCIWGSFSCTRILQCRAASSGPQLFLVSRCSGGFAMRCFHETPPCEQLSPTLEGRLSANFRQLISSKFHWHDTTVTSLPLSEPQPCPPQ